jgi:hypothetical protein
LHRQNQCHQWNGEQRRADTQRALYQPPAQKRECAPGNDLEIYLVEHGLSGVNLVSTARQVCKGVL